MGSAHIIRTRSGIVPPKTAIYCGPHCGKLPLINATNARHKPTIMSGSVPQKSDVALQAHLNTLMFPRKFLIGHHGNPLFSSKKFEIEFCLYPDFPFAKKRNRPDFVDISPTLVIDTSTKRYLRVLQLGNQNFFLKKFEFELYFDLC